MRLPSVRCWLLSAAAAGAAGMALDVPAAFGQAPVTQGPPAGFYAPVAVAQAPAPTTPPTTPPAPRTPPATTTPGTTPGTRPGQPQAEEPANNPELGAAVGGEQTAYAPNMIGHLLMAFQSVNFRYNRAAGPVNVANNGSTSVVNPAVADDNSPLPRDRVSFRFNYFDNAQQVTGFGPATFNAQGVGTAFAKTRDFSVEQYTFIGEKTFLNGWGSLEMRLPFSTGLSSDLNLSAGDITGPVGGNAFNVNSTPDRTLGSYGTHFDNMTLILKGLAYRSTPLAISGGLALGIPTGDDTDVHVTDYSGGVSQGVATLQRQRDIHIDNETWSLSPFVAALYTPNDRFFAQGFLQLDFPLNANTINYTDTFTRGTAPSIALLSQVPGLIRFPSLDPPFAVRSGISDQPLLQVDVGTGYWLLRDPKAAWITGIAPSLELHYTTTLKNSSVVTLPGDPLLQINPNAPGKLIQEQPPRVGNLNNRVDILDMTVATTVMISDRATLATGVTFPLKEGGNRTFDWEAHLQLNYYFRGVGRRAAPSY